MLRAHYPLNVPLYLTEADVTALLTPADAVAAVEGSFERLARGAIDNRPRQRMPLEEGVFAVMSAVDHELGYAGVKSYAWLPGGTPFVVLLFSVAIPLCPLPPANLPSSVRYESSAFA